MERCKATVIGQDGAVHVKIVDELERPHWLLPSQFDGPVVNTPGTKLIIEKRGHYWHALKLKGK